MLKIDIYTDGSCINNPGPGGCASIIKFIKKEIILKAGYYYTTNNRMELMAFILSLKFLVNNFYINNNINVFTDSTYLYNGVNYWIYSWKKNNWKKSNNKFIKNIDLWSLIYKNIILFKKKIKWNLLKSHKGNYYNNKCDKIAFLSAKNPMFFDYSKYFFN